MPQVAALVGEVLKNDERKYKNASLPEGRLELTSKSLLFGCSEGSSCKARGEGALVTDGFDLEVALSKCEICAACTKEWKRRNYFLIFKYKIGQMLTLQIRETVFACISMAR